MLNIDAVRREIAALERQREDLQSNLLITEGSLRAMRRVERMLGEEDQTANNPEAKAEDKPKADGVDPSVVAARYKDNKDPTVIVESEQKKANGKG